MSATRTRPWTAAGSRARSLVRRVRDRTGDDAGQVSAFVAIMAVALILFAGLVLDAGLALSAKVQALDAAQAAARAGARQLNLSAYREHNTAQLDPARAEAAARGWLSSAGLDGTVSATTTTVTVTVTRASRTQLLQPDRPQRRPQPAPRGHRHRGPRQVPGPRQRQRPIPHRPPS